MTGNTERRSSTSPENIWLGPQPRLSLKALVDVGMSDAAIGRYLRIEAEAVAQLRRRYGVADQRRSAETSTAPQGGPSRRPSRWLPGYRSHHAAPVQWSSSF